MYASNIFASICAWTETGNQTYYSNLKFEQEAEKEVLGMSHEELWRTSDSLKKLLC